MTRPPLPSRRPATLAVATLVALAACRSAPPPVQFDPDPLTKWRWRGQLAPAPAPTADASGSAVAPAPPPLAGGRSTGTRTLASTASGGDVALAASSAAPAPHHLSGAAVVQPGTRPDETVAFVTIAGAPAGSWWRWRLVDGDCRGGTAVAPAERYPVLQASADGYAEALVALPVAAPRSARWAVEVLRADGATAVACGALALSR